MLNISPTILIVVNFSQNKSKKYINKNYVQYNLLNILKYNFSVLWFDFVMNSTCPGPGFVRFPPTQQRK